jgi:ABC-2 type transport system ATP-binding protein
MATISSKTDGGHTPVPYARPVRQGAGTGPVMIEVRGLTKTFRIPDRRVDTLKERVTHPFRQVNYRNLEALRDVSFEVHRGEFFGIVGRNGSGKSTLLKIMASIYRADAGSVRIAGTLAPFIELGVGFKPDLTARENIILNGVLFGLTRREAQRRVDAVIDFAELRDFSELKVKNYSSGMMVRLAFSIMVQADSDIMLIDEVLAVGDAAFSEKCMDVFYERRRVGKTVVLVTHDMAAIQSLCHRAMLLHEGGIDYLGEPEDAALRYYRLNFSPDTTAEGDAVRAPGGTDVAVEINGRAVRAELLDEARRPVSKVEQGTPVVLDIEIEAARELRSPTFVINVVNHDHVVVFGFVCEVGHSVAPGQRIRLSGEIENRFLPGRHYIDVWVGRNRGQGELSLQCIRAIQFSVFGTQGRFGVVSLHTNVAATVQGAS